ncbi:MAG: hypothetical protein OES38_02925 [Gammaproteobacteria bacterium]|nr:hypothetical protein [Gammaproteobacteria bacterium]
MSSQQTGESGILMLVVTLILACVLVQNGYQTFQIIDDRDRLAQRIEAQETSVRDAEKVRAQLLSIAGQTAALAEQGNPNAIRLVELLRAQGVTVRPPEP